MGSLSSRPLEVILIGQCGSGKTHFLDELVYGEHAIQRPTFGTYKTSYDYNGMLINFTEYGGSVQLTAWENLYRKAAAVDGLYVFIKDNPFQIYGQMMHFLSIRRVEFVIVILTQGGADPAEVKEQFQLQKLSVVLKTRFHLAVLTEHNFEMILALTVAK